MHGVRFFLGGPAPEAGWAMADRNTKEAALEQRYAGPPALMASLVAFFPEMFLFRSVVSLRRLSPRTRPQHLQEGPSLRRQAKPTVPGGGPAQTYVRGLWARSFNEEEARLG